MKRNLVIVGLVALAAGAMGLAGCNGNSETPPSSDQASAKENQKSTGVPAVPSVDAAPPVNLFRAKFASARDQISEVPTNDEKRSWVMMSSECIGSSERTIGDRYFCLTSWQDARLNLAQAPLHLKKMMASNLAFALSEPGLKSVGDFQKSTFQVMGLSIGLKLGLIELFDSKQAAEVQQSLTPESKLDPMFPAQQKMKGEIIQALISKQVQS